VNIHTNKKVSILIFASGNGSNAENIIRYFNDRNTVINWTIVTNNPNAGVIEKSKKLNIPYLIFEKKDFVNERVLNLASEMNPSLIILAGFLLKISLRLINRFPNKIINIHPSLLPKYGGKGMYGMNVHKKVLKNKEIESGISIHYVNKNYDEGKIIFQKSVSIQYPCDAETLSKNINKVEMKYFPMVISKLLNI